MPVDHRLVTYGTLAPGRCNHHELSGLTGRWERGTVKGMFTERGWGADLGYPALVLVDDGQPVPVDLFTSPDLPEHWARLDAFEGDGYRRTAIRVETDAGPVMAWIYSAADPQPD